MFWLVLSCWLGVLTLFPVLKALAQASAEEGQKPSAEKKNSAPTTAGCIMTDSTIPINPGHVNVATMWALSLYPGTFNQNWRTISIHGNFYTFFMPVKVTYGLARNMEVYLIVPFLNYWVTQADQSIAVNGRTSASYAGIGDLTLMGKYLLYPEGEVRPAVSAVAGFGTIPTGHASHLNPRFMGVDAIGTGALTLSTGVNLYKWAQPFLLYSTVWINSPINLYRMTTLASPQPVRSREYLTFNLAAEYPLNSKFVLLLEMYSSWTWQNLLPFQASQGYQTPETLLGLMPGIEFLATERFTLEAGAALDIMGKNNVKKFTPMLMATYAF
ncbi:MAG: transporter [Deltaproteobacteria bacterium]|nr:transporter [Deltaproteobacteria bacterium]